MIQEFYIKNGYRAIDSFCLKYRKQLYNYTIQNKLNNYYNDKKYSVECSCSSVPMHVKYLKGSNKFIISTNGGHADKHLEYCMYNNIVKSMDEHYYNFEKEECHVRLFIEISPDEINGSVHEDEPLITYRLIDEEEDDLCKKVYREYRRYKRFNELCAEVILDTIEELDKQYVEIDIFRKALVRQLSRTQVFIGKKSMGLFESARKKHFFVDNKLLYKENDFNHLSNYCHKKGFIKLLERAKKKNKAFFTLNVKFQNQCTSLFLIEVDIKEIQQDNKSEVLKLNTILLNLKNEIDTIHEEIDSLTKKAQEHENNELDKIQNIQKSESIEKVRIKNKIQDIIENEPDKKLLFFKNNAKEEKINELNNHINTFIENCQRTKQELYYRLDIEKESFRGKENHLSTKLANLNDTYKVQHSTLVKLNNSIERMIDLNSLSKRLS